jgi:two-component system, cell cycle sensor histidine kinase and response regulator CckA
LVGGGEAIAIVDDEPSIREILGTTLEAYDYRIFTAEDGDRAIELYANRHSEIRMMLLDYMMPGAELEETIDRLLAIDPDLKIIVMSGLSADDIVGSDRVCAFLPKPFSTRDLLHVLKTALN